MHIGEGVLSGSPEGIAVLGAGIAVAAAGTAWALRRMDYEQVPQVAMLSAAFFVVSLVHVPMPGTSVHLVLSGLLGLLLGWAAFPAILVALLLQAVFFGHGGLTTLGINTTIMAVPAVASYYLFHPATGWRRDKAAFWGAFAAGAVAFMLAGMLHAGAYVAAGKPFQVVALAVLSAHVAVAVVEGLVTGSAVAFLRKVRPELLEAPLVAAGR